MTRVEALSILSMVRAGIASPSVEEVTKALVMSGDLDPDYYARDIEAVLTYDTHHNNAESMRQHLERVAVTH